MFLRIESSKLSFIWKPQDEIKSFWNVELSCNGSNKNIQFFAMDIELCKFWRNFFLINQIIKNYKYFFSLPLPIVYVI